MASYCEYGHVWGEHVEYDGDEEGNVQVEHIAYGCLGDDGTCGCTGFEEVPPEILERGWD